MLNEWTGCGRRNNRPDAGGTSELYKADDPDDDDDDEAPETPLDEPTPPRVQDPPAEPDPKPYVVSRKYMEAVD